MRKGKLKAPGLLWTVLLAAALLLTVNSDFSLAKAAESAPKDLPAEKAETGTPMTFRILRLSSPVCEPNCAEWIAAEGEITDQTPAKLAKLLADPAKRNLPIMLNSPGGRVNAAMIMGRMIRKYAMNTAVADSTPLDCNGLKLYTNHCPDDGKVHPGSTSSWGSYCNSACTLMLLGGRVRLAAGPAVLGLHQPHGETQRYIDHYIDTYRIINGKRKIIAHRFIKRTYEKPKAYAGVTPDMKPRYLSYLKEMGASPQILVEMDKASPKDINEIPFVAGGGLRQQLGLVTDENLGATALVSDDHCRSSGKLSSNCIMRKDFVTDRPAQSAGPCYVLSGCGPAKADPNAKSVPCFSATGCSAGDKIATLEWLNKRDSAKTATPGIPLVPCFIASGCSKTDQTVLPDSGRNGEADMSFALMRATDEECRPRCAEWIAAEGWITPATPAKLAKFLSSINARGFPIFLQSHGGDFDAAVQLGHIIHEFELITAVAASSAFACKIGEKWPKDCRLQVGAANAAFANSVGSYCERACVVALLGGKFRIVASDASVGVEGLPIDKKFALQEYFRGLQRSASIIDYMDTALSTGYLTVQDQGVRERTGLASKPLLTLDSLIGGDHCKTYGKLSANCVEIKEKEPQTAAAP